MGLRRDLGGGAKTINMGYDEVTCRNYDGFIAVGQISRTEMLRVCRTDLGKLYWNGAFEHLALHYLFLVWW